MERMEEKPKNPTYRSCPDDLSYNLVFFSTFEELTLPIKGPMEDAGLIKLYEPFPKPCLYVAPAENMVGRVPLIPCVFWLVTPLQQSHMFSKRKDSGFPFSCADTTAADGKRGSNVYEVNPWLWQFGRGKTRLGGLTVKETTERKKAARDERFKHGWETRRRRKADKD
jgi:hypothetical protein